MVSDYNGKKRKLFEPKIPHFFKIILQESVDGGRLEIPRKFVMKYGNDLPNRISLQVPSGTIWKVDLLKTDGRVYMQNGWREFQEYYSIAHGTFLSFEYTSRSFFQVIVYDLSTTEIVYPYDDDDCKEPVYEREYEEARSGLNAENKPDVLILDDYLPSSSTKRKISPFPCPRPPKMGRTGDASGSDRKSKLHTSSTSDKGCDNVSNVAAKSRHLKNLGSDDSSLNKSGASKLKNPSFSVVMKPAYTSGHYVNINMNFARNYLKQDRGNITLQNSEKRTWTVGYVIYNEHDKARLASGWSVFVQDNKLVPGTECVFELIDHAKLVLNVDITRASTSNRKSEKLTDIAHPWSLVLQSEDSCKDRGKQQLSGSKCKLGYKDVSKKLIADERNGALSRAIAAWQPENLFFRVVIQPTYTGVRLDVPFLFAKRHFKKNDCAIVLQNVNGRSWNVVCRINSKKRRAYFRSNWAAFVRGNNLKIGDICTFELTQSAKLVMNFDIVRAGSMDGSNAPEVGC